MIDEQQKDFLTVSELNQYIQDVIQSGFPGSVWVCGEIQGYNRSRTKKHVFFDLCEKDEDTQDVLAKIGLVIFYNRKQVIQKILTESGDPFGLKDDIEVKFLCKVDFYPPHGALRLIVESIDPSYTLGKIAAEKQRLIALLKKKGMLDKNKKVEMPAVPLRIGLITSYDSAAYNDFLSELEHSGFGFQVFYLNALMQGKAAEKDVCKALKELYRLSKNFDVIVLTRGGGSIADLSCFDSQKIAETIAGSPIPILTGIGHEIDLSIADLAAHNYHKTPTAVAQFLISRVEEVLREMEEYGSTLVDIVQERLREESDCLRGLVMNFQQDVQGFLNMHQQEVVRLREIISRAPVPVMESRFQEVKHVRAALVSKLMVFLKQEQKKLTHCERFFEIASPKNILKKGFSISRTKEGKLIRSIHDVEEKDEMETEVFDGVIKSTVTNVKEEE